MKIDDKVKIETYDLILAYSLLTQYVSLIKDKCSSDDLISYNELLLRFEIKIKKTQARANYKDNKETYHNFMGSIAKLESRLTAH